MNLAKFVYIQCMIAENRLNIFLTGMYIFKHNLPINKVIHPCSRPWPTFLGPNAKPH